MDDSRQAALASLNLPPAVLAFLIALDAPGSLRHLFQPPFYFYSVGGPDKPGDWPQFTGRTLIPLWEHSEAIFVAEPGATGCAYFSFYLESPDEAQAFGRSIYRPLLHMLALHVWEYGGGESEVAEAIALAKRLGFPAIDRLVALLADPMCSEEEIDAYARSLPD